ncbi:MAG TPA: hypothetical protein QGG37_05550 [Chloroflexota bacterium]|nr:hypothetical protein [Chloroflexota bacterium]
MARRRVHPVHIDQYLSNNLVDLRWDHRANIQLGQHLHQVGIFVTLDSVLLG